METSTKMSKVNSSLTSYLFKSNSLNTAFLKITMLSFFVLNTSMLLAQSNSCSIDLKVDKDRNTRSTPPAGTYYAMVITNKSSNSDTVTLTSIDVNSICANSDGSSSSTNVALDVEFLDKNLKPISEIKMNSGETINFFAHILVPKGTPYDKWSCTKVVAKSKICPSYKADTILHTLVINPNEDN